MAQGPSLQGQIIINTKSVADAITSVKRLEVSVGKAFGKGSQSASRFAKELSKQDAVYQKLANSTGKYSTVIAKAANTVANYEAAVKKSNISDAKKEKLIKAASAQLKGFETAVKSGASSGKALTNVTTQLNVSLGQLKRDLSGASKAASDKATAAANLEKAEIRNAKAVSTANQAYLKSKQAIQDSSLPIADKTRLTRQLTAEHNRLNGVLSKTNTTLKASSAAQNRFKESIAEAGRATKNANMGSAAKATSGYAKEMRNLSTSVVVALGPLSGVASRLTALTTLFNRNAASIALVLASMTGLTVLFSRSMTVAQEAEKQMFRMNAQLEILGDKAPIAGEAVNEMAHQIAAGTLLSAKQARDGAGALLQFGGIARSQFKSVIETAQGMSAVFGGNLRGNIRKLGRAIEDPVDGIQRLERSGVILTKQVRDQIVALTAMGRKYEATALLLKQTESLQKAAAGEAEGLAGAFDTVSGNLDRLFEELFNASGAADSMAASVNTMADAIKDFSNSAEAAAIGQIFKKISTVAGPAFRALIDNLHIVSGVFIFVAGSVIPKLLTALITLGKLITTKVVSGFVAARGAVTGYGVAATGAAAAQERLNLVMKANPIWAIVGGVTALVGAIWSYKSAIDAVNQAGGAFNKSIADQVRAELTIRNDLTKAYVDETNTKLNQLERLRSAHTTKMEAMKKKEKELEGQTRSVLKELSKVYEGGNFGLGSFESIKGNMEEIERLASSGKLNEEQQAWADEIIENNRNLKKQKEAIEEVEAAERSLYEAVTGRKAKDPQTPDQKRLEDIRGTVSEKSADFLGDEAKVRSLKEQRKQLVNMSGELLGLNVDQKVILEEWKKVERIIGAIDEELAEMSTVEVSKEAKKLYDTLADITDEARRTQELLGASESEQALIKLNHEMEDIAENAEKLMNEISASELAKFGEALPGVDAASGVDAVTEAYVRYLKAKKEATLEAEKEAEANGLVDDFLNSQKTSMDKVRDKYRETRAAMNKSGRTSGIDALRQKFEKDSGNINDESEAISKTPFSDLERIEEDFKIRQDRIKELNAEEEEDHLAHLEIMKKQAEKAKVFQGFISGAEQAQMVVGGAMEAMEAAGKEGTAAHKAMAIAQAGINAALAISQVLADPTLHTGVKIAMAGVIGATAGAQVAAIQSENYASGGLVRGPGTGTSDSISANLSNGEYVLKADAVRQIGLRNLQMMNTGNMPAFSEGGSVGMPVNAMGNNGGGGASVNFTVIDQSSGDKEFKQEETINSRGEREMKLMITDVVKQSMARGEMDRDFSANFGVKRQGRKV